MGFEQVEVAASLLDRLLPRRLGTATGETGTEWGIAEERNALRRDIEDLLNTHVCPELLSSLPQALHGSLLAYGLPETCAFSIYEPEERAALRDSIARALVAFEPRLRLFEVNLGKSGSDRLRLEITGELILGRAIERVTFDATLSMQTHSFDVKEAQRR